ELFVVAIGNLVDDWRYLEGGLPYLAGDPKLFLSMVLLWRQCGTCLPPVAASRASQGYEDTISGKELETLPARLQNQPRNSTLSLESESMAFLMTTSLFKSLGPHQEQFPLPWLFTTDDGASLLLPTTAEEIPKWWRELGVFWDAALGRYIESKRLPCMWQLTPIGCQAAQACPHVHDNAYRKGVEKLKRFSFFVCANCKKCATKKCMACKARWYCSQECMKADWKMKHKRECALDKAAMESLS
ncbi:hypothetical protein HDU98_003492, partial [Podochytrium sp. JEL0797]